MKISETVTGTDGQDLCKQIEFSGDEIDGSDSNIAATLNSPLPARSSIDAALQGMIWATKE